MLKLQNGRRSRDATVISRDSPKLRLTNPVLRSTYTLLLLLYYIVTAWPLYSNLNDWPKYRLIFYLNHWHRTISQLAYHISSEIHSFRLLSIPIQKLRAVLVRKDHERLLLSDFWHLRDRFFTIWVYWSFLFAFLRWHPQPSQSVWQKNQIPSTFDVLQDSWGGFQIRTTIFRAKPWNKMVVSSLERDKNGSTRFNGCSNIRDFEFQGKLGEGTFG